MSLRRFFVRCKFLCLLLVALFLTIACQPPSPQSGSQTSGTGESVFLNGTGATFPLFLYQRWFSEYNQAHPNVQINYQPVGSAAGIQQVIAGTVDFGASDIAMSDEEMAQVEQGVVLLPMTAGSIAITYNLPGVGSGLKLSREAYTEIFLGKISQWNDPKIAELNPDLSLPKQPISLVHRSDGSGTTAAFTAHLSDISDDWQKTVGSGLSVQWPAGVGIKSNAGVSAQIQQAEGTIGYVEYSYAQQLGLATAALENQAGEYVLPTLEATASALSQVEMPEDLRTFITDPDGADAYPIVTYSWLLAYQTYADANKAEALKSVIQWALMEGQSFSEELGYVPLPKDVAEKAMAAAEQIAS